MIPQKDAGGLPRLHRNSQRPRDFGAFAASADFETERGPIDDPTGRDSERECNISERTLSEENRADDRNVR